MKIAILHNLAVAALPRQARRRFWLRVGHPLLLSEGRVLTIHQDRYLDAEGELVGLLLRFQLRLANGHTVTATSPEQLRALVADVLVRCVQWDEHGADRALVDVGLWAAHPDLASVA